MLETAFRRQQAFTSKVVEYSDHTPIDKLDQVARTRWTKDYILSLMAELKEVLDCLNWKHHRTTDIGPRIDLVEELVDVQKFLWGLFYIWGVNIQEFETEFNRKSDVVDQRWKQEHELPSVLSASTVAVVDIDGVLADYPRSFLQWAQTFQPGIDLETLNKAINPLLWERLKHEYRVSGGERTAPVKEGAAEGLKLLREAGYTIMLLSNRPVKQYSRIIADTVEWLKDNGLVYDHIFWPHFDKGVDIVDRFPTVSVVFDDEPAVIAAARSVGVTACQIGTEYSSLKEAVLGLDGQQT